MEGQDRSIIARRTILALFASGTAVLLGSCGLLDSHAAYRFRMTVEAQTPQGIISGSSVYEVRAEKNNSKILAEERAGGSATIGEALAFEMPNGPTFALTKVSPERESLQRVVTQALKPGTQLGGIDNFLPAVQSLGGWFSGTAKAELPREDWPIMVRFRDINDPKTVELIDPAALGVKRILVETTSEPVTTGIERRFSWWSAYRDRHLDGTSTVSEDLTDPSIAAHLSARSFSTEIGK